MLGRLIAVSPGLGWLDFDIFLKVDLIDTRGSDHVRCTNVETGRQEAKESLLAKKELSSLSRAGPTVEHDSLPPAQPEASAFTTTRVCVCQ